MLLVVPSLRGQTAGGVATNKQTVAPSCLGRTRYKLWVVCVLKAYVNIVMPYVLDATLHVPPTTTTATNKIVVCGVAASANLCTRFLWVFLCIPGY